MRGLMGRTLAAIIVTALLALGCSSSSTGPNPEAADQTEYKVRASPENVIYNLEKAYDRMDAEVYLNCLAEDFIFFLNPDDLNDYPALPEYWDKVAETTIHERMFGDSTDVQDVTLTATYVTSVCDGGNPGDPLDDLWTFIEDITLRVRLPSDLILQAQAPAEFLFRVDPDEIGPNGEILWEIWKQWDLDEGTRGRSSAGRRETSWGLVKAMYWGE